VVISYRWESSCGRWNESSNNPFSTLSFDDKKELDVIFSNLVEQNKKNNIRSNINIIERESIEKWTSSDKIKIRYYWGCVGQSFTAHRVKCLTVTKNKELLILRASVNCGSDVASDKDEDLHLIQRRAIYLIHNSKLSKFKVCKRCSSTHI